MIVYLRGLVLDIQKKAEKCDLLQATHTQEMGFVHEVDQATRCCDQNVTAFLQLFTLVTNRCATIGNTWTEH